MQPNAISAGVTVVQGFRVNGGPLIEIEKHHQDVVEALYAYNRVAAIKFVRAEYELGLKEAKDICDYIGQSVVPLRVCSGNGRCGPHF